ncbi:MAG: histidinol-phosphate aminotransferase family protein [Proteobacteria bacterium]|nr:histidinol-phosphate aminotransferase family protein [Pseudomonadota bacterium]
MLASSETNHLAVPSRVHGGLLDHELAELGIEPHEIVDFSVNTNPYGPQPAVVAAARAASIEIYPDPTGRSVREALGRHLDVDSDRLVLGNGEAELLWTAAAALIRPGDAVLIAEPTFSEFTAAARARGGRIAEWRASEEDGFAVDLSAIEKRLRDCGATVAYLCTPNNPTGVGCPIEELIELARRAARVTFVIDQAFLGLSDHYRDMDISVPDNLILCRSLTKEHTIPGLRAGYVITTRELALALERNRPPWTTSAPALAAILATIDEQPFVDQARLRLMKDRHYLAGALGQLGLCPVASTTSFVAVRVGHSGEVRRELLVGHRILVRDCRSFGLDGFIRIAARPRDQTERLIAALAEVLP